MMLDVRFLPNPYYREDLRPLTGRDVLQKTVRGQYKAGASNGKPVVGYLDEKDVPADSTTGIGPWATSSTLEPVA